MRLAKALSLRLLFGLLSLIFISIITFFASSLAPGDPARLIAGEKATEETYQRIRQNLGLDKPWPERYVLYVGKAVQGDFGKSYYGTREEVKTILAERLPVTYKIATSAMILAILIGVSLGTVAAIKETRVVDRGILTLSTLGVTIPNFVLAPILVYFFALKMDLLPVTWEAKLRAPELFYLILPVLTLSLRPTALLTRLTRASMVETLKQEFIRTAVAKGVPPGRMYLRHGLRNAILPVITAVGTSYGFLLTGSFVVETAFLLPGIGSKTIDAIRTNDIPVIQACVLVTGTTFVLINLLVDMILPILDPRIRESQV